MNRAFSVFGLLLIVILPIRMAWILYDDFTHPESWKTKPFYEDPRFYLPLNIVIVLLFLLWFIPAWRKHKAEMAGAARRQAFMAEAIRVLQGLNDTRRSRPEPMPKAFDYNPDRTIDPGAFSKFKMPKWD